MGTATLGGLIAGGLLSTILSTVDLPFSTVIGAFIGGIVAAYVLYGKLGQAATAGALAGVLGTPFFLGLSQILAIFNLIPVPSGPTPSLSELQGAVVIIVLMNLVAGSVGGLLLGLVHRPTQLPPPPPAPPGFPAAQNRYCVQCGAQMLPATLICPHCSARQPQ